MFVWKKVIELRSEKLKNHLDTGKFEPDYRIGDMNVMIRSVAFELITRYLTLEEGQKSEPLIQCLITIINETFELYLGLFKQIMDRRIEDHKAAVMFQTFGGTTLL